MPRLAEHPCADAPVDAGELAALRTLCVECVRAGSAAIAALEGEAAIVTRKTSALDYATSADLASERRIVALLRARRPHDGIVAEESGAGGASGGRRWVIDPVDGTRNFARRIPLYAVSVAVVDARGALAGAVLDVAHNELFSAARGMGALQSLNDGPERPCFAGPSPDGARIVATGFSARPESRPTELARLAAVAGCVDEVRTGTSAALELCWVADGRADGYFEAELSEWDWAAGALIAAEAGARVGDGNGGAPSSAMVLAATAHLYTVLARVLSSVDAAYGAPAPGR